jgi:hypothetical protein
MNWVQVSLCMRESYQQLRGLSLLVIGIVRGHWCFTALNIHAPAEDKIDDMKGGSYS